MAFQQTAYNNYDPRPMPVGTDLMARGGGNYSDSGIADDFIPEISQENDLPFLGRCNFPNKADEVYPCMPSQALHLDRRALTSPSVGEPPVRSHQPSAVKAWSRHPRRDRIAAIRRSDHVSTTPGSQKCVQSDPRPCV